MIKECDMVVLTHDIKENDLTGGDIGVVVHCYGNRKAYEVEFATAEGKTLAVLTLTAEDVRLMKEKNPACKRSGAESIIQQPTGVRT